MDNYQGLIDEWPDDTSAEKMEYCVKNNLDNINRKYLNEINEIDVGEERGNTKAIRHEDVIHIDITINEPETNQDTLKKWE